MILTTIEQFIEAIPTAAEVENFDDLKPYCNSAELWLKNKVLGKNLYDAANVVDFADADLLRLCRNVIANHAYWDAIPFLDLVHTNSGFGVISANNRVPASKERVERLREQCLIRRDNEVENLIDYLEITIVYHDSWKGSPAYSILSDCLIQTASELENYSEWTGTRKDFLKLRPKLIQETMLRMEPVFSSVYIAELIEKQRDGDLTADDRNVLVLIKQSLGCLVTGSIDTTHKIAADALRYIDANIESFATYYGSAEYAARILENYANDLESPIFSSIY